MKNTKEIFRVILAVSMVIAGVTHFTSADQYVRIVPPQLPYPLGLVYLSGFYEILGGIGLLVPPVSQAAAWGLIALFIAVYPSNINMAVNHIKIDHIPDSNLLQAIRLPFQAVFIAWAWWYTKNPENQSEVKSVAGEFDIDS